MSDNEKNLKNVMSDFLGSYAERDQSEDFNRWLAGRLQEEMPDMSADEGEKLGADIIEAVAGYDRALGELNDAIESGQSKESWLADKMMEACGDMPDNEAGGKFRQLYNDLDASNTELMCMMDGAESEIADGEIEEVADWNEYSLKSEALNIGKQAVMAGLGVMANGIKESRESGEAAAMGEVISDALKEGMDVAKHEVKAVVAGAVKVAANKGLTSMLPEDTPVEFIGDMAGAAVESAEAMLDVAMGKSTMTEAMDKAGRASVAVVCRHAALALKGAIIQVPYVGPILVWLAGGLFEHIESPQCAENVYKTVSDIAKATWKGIKERVGGLVNKVMNKNVQYSQQ
jgi:predicted house-cleaning noncanonical NTP pyrophosphatase (MazG superfamily)